MTRHAVVVGGVAKGMVRNWLPRLERLGFSYEHFERGPHMRALLAEDLPAADVYILLTDHAGHADGWATTAAAKARGIPLVVGAEESFALTYSRLRETFQDLGPMEPEEEDRPGEKRRLAKKGLAAPRPPTPGELKQLDMQIRQEVGFTGVYSVGPLPEPSPELAVTGLLEALVPPAPRKDPEEALVPECRRYTREEIIAEEVRRMGGTIREKVLAFMERHRGQVVQTKEIRGALGLKTKDEMTVMSQVLRRHCKPVDIENVRRHFRWVLPLDSKPSTPAPAPPPPPTSLVASGQTAQFFEALLAGRVELTLTVAIRARKEAE